LVTCSNVTLAMLLLIRPGFYNNTELSLRGAQFATKQSPLITICDCFSSFDCAPLRTLAMTCDVTR
jgi:hypothetical protein